MWRARTSTPIFLHPPLPPFPVYQQPAFQLADKLETTFLRLSFLPFSRPLLPPPPLFPEFLPPPPPSPPPPPYQFICPRLSVARFTSTHPPSQETEQIHRRFASTLVRGDPSTTRRNRRGGRAVRKDDDAASPSPVHGSS